MIQGGGCVRVEGEVRPMEILAVIGISAIVLCLITVVFCFFMLFRNDWVFKQRQRLLDENFFEYSKYWSYEKMLQKFYIWDVEKMRDA